MIEQLSQLPRYGRRTISTSDMQANFASLESGPTVHLTLHGFIGPAARKLAVLIQNRDTAKKESQNWQCCIRLYIMLIIVAD